MVSVPFLVVGEILLYMLCSCWPWSPPTRAQSLAKMSGMLDLSSDENAKHFPTVIEGEVRDGKLLITVHNIYTGQVQETLTIAKRR